MDLQNVLIVGGGIGGMSAALALSAAGYRVTLVERERDWGALGAGLTVLGSTLRALSKVGVIDAVMREGYFARENSFYRYTGEFLFKRPAMTMADADLPGAGGILRPVLHRILAEEMAARNISVRVGITADRLEQSTDKVEVGFSDGSCAQFDLVVAADGLQSSIRKKLFPDAPTPQFTGQGCWRLIADRPASIDRSSFYIGGPVTVGTVPVSQSQMYVWVLEQVPDNPWIAPHEQPHRLAGLLKDFGGEVAKLRDGMTSQSTIVYRPLEALLMPAPWYSGRVLLLGDAAHATTPHLASGAGIAVEDGVVLAEELRRADTLESALEAHMARRFERCRMVVENSVEIGRVEMAHQSERINQIMNESQAQLAQPF